MCLFQLSNFLEIYLLILIAVNLHLKQEGSEHSESIMNFIDLSNFLQSAPMEMMILWPWGTRMWWTEGQGGRICTWLRRKAGCTSHSMLQKRVG